MLPGPIIMAHQSNTFISFNWPYWRSLYQGHNIIQVKNWVSHYLKYLKAVCTSSKLLCTKPFLLVWVEMLLAEISWPCNLNQGDRNWYPKCNLWEPLRLCLHVVGPLVPFRKNFETLSKQKHGNTHGNSPGNTLGTPNLPGLVNNALHYTLGTHVHKPQACLPE